MNLIGSDYPPPPPSIIFLLGCPWPSPSSSSIIFSAVFWQRVPQYGKQFMASNLTYTPEPTQTFCHSINSGPLIERSKQIIPLKGVCHQISTYIFFFFEPTWPQVNMLRYYRIGFDFCKIFKFYFPKIFRMLSVKQFKGIFRHRCSINQSKASIFLLLFEGFLSLAYWMIHREIIYPDGQSESSS